MNEDTFAGHAARGVWIDIKCGGCGRESSRTAADLAANGWATIRLVGSQERFRCPCGHRGAALWLYGYWCGPGPQPADWAATAEARMRLACGDGAGPPDG